jgi:hypothetical protein
MEHMLKRGEDELKKGSLNVMEEAMASMSDPAVVAEMSKMMHDPSFKDQLKAMTQDPKFKDYVDAVRALFCYKMFVAYMFAANTDCQDRQCRYTDARNDERSSKEEKGGSPKRSGAWVVVNTCSFAIQIVTRHIYFRDMLVL